MKVVLTALLEKIQA